jgi:hypothetical protein
VNQYRFDRVARAGFLRLCVFDNIDRVFNIRRRVNEDMTVTLSGFDHRNTRIAYHPSDKLTYARGTRPFHIGGVCGKNSGAFRIDCGAYGCKRLSFCSQVCATRTLCPRFNE